MGKSGKPKASSPWSPYVAPYPSPIQALPCLASKVGLPEAALVSGMAGRGRWMVNRKPWNQGVVGKQGSKQGKVGKKQEAKTLPPPQCPQAVFHPSHSHARLCLALRLQCPQAARGC